MGAGYSANLFKVKLKMATQRITLSISKKTNQIKVDRKNVGELLAKKKDESARIRVESMIHQQNLISVMEIVSLMCELLQTRLGLITSSMYPPPDLVEAMATIIFCANRVEIPELLEIAQQIAHKFKREWAMMHLNNDLGKVNPKIVAKLSVKPPPFPLVLAYLKEIAAYYQLDWEPNLEEPKKEDEDDINRLGSIARIDIDPASGEVIGGTRPTGDGIDPDIDELEALAPPPGANRGGAAGRGGGGGGGEIKRNNNASPQPPTFDPSIGSPPAHIGTGGVADLFPGTLNVIVHKARELYDAKHGGKQDPFIKLGIRSQPPTLKTTADHNGGQAPKWAQEHFPFGVKDPSAQLSIEAYNQGAITDDFLGGTVLSVGDIICRPGPEWYPLGRDAGGKRKPAGALLLSIQYLPLSASTTIVLPPGAGIPDSAPQHQQMLPPQQQFQQQPPQQQPYFPGGGMQYPAGGMGGGYLSQPGYPAAPAVSPPAGGGYGADGHFSAPAPVVMHGMAAQSAGFVGQVGPNSGYGTAPVMGVSSGSVARNAGGYGHNDDFGGEASYQAMTDDMSGVRRTGAANAGSSNYIGANAGNRRAPPSMDRAGVTSPTNDQLCEAAPIPSPPGGIPNYSPDDHDDEDMAPPAYPGAGVGVERKAAPGHGRSPSGAAGGRGGSAAAAAGGRGGHARNGSSGTRMASDGSKLEHPLLKPAAPAKLEEQPDMLFPMREFGDMLKKKSAAPMPSSSADDDLEARFRALNDQ